MPTTVKKREDKYRVVEEAKGRNVRNKEGTAVDGGGKKSKASVQKQATAINISQARKRGAKIPKKK